MMKPKRWILGIAALGLAVAAVPVHQAQADDPDEVEITAEAVPDALTHQGRLIDDEGQPISGEVELTYTIWDHPTEGAVIWQDVVEAEVDETGFYSVELGGDANPIDASVVADGAGWLGVAVDDGDELDPRISLNAVPYALVAEEALVAGEAGFASEAGLAQEAEFAGQADIAAQVEEGSIGAEALADDFQLDPEHIEEATGETLEGLSCANGDIARFDGTNWNCDDTVAHADEATHAATADHADEADFAEEADTAGYADVAAEVEGETLGGLNCANGDVATFDGNSWHCTAAATGTVTEVTATAPLESSGGTEPTISIDRADSDTSGYLHAEDFASFDNRVEEGDPRLTDAREPLPGSSHYIHNQSSSPQDASLNIADDAIVGDRVGIGMEELNSEVALHVQGGSEATSTETYFRSFTDDGTFTVPDGVDELDVLVVAGGGGGGADQGGGGGAGGLIFEEDYSVTEGEEIEVTVGDGGAPSPERGESSEDGEDSSFGSLEATGGGGGGSHEDAVLAGSDGGSGGGTAGNSGDETTDYGEGIDGQGNDGGYQPGGNSGGGAGGGGYAEAGGNSRSDTAGGHGGDGIYLGDVFGDNVGDDGWFAGGGGGGANSNDADYGEGGRGGGGDGGRLTGDDRFGRAGMPGTGGGGGGGEGTGSSSGGAGGSGVVIVRWEEETDIEVGAVIEDGNVGIGTTDPSHRLTVQGDAAKVGGGSWDVYSDERLKRDITPYTAGLDEITALEPIRYHYDQDNALGVPSREEHIGFSAQQVERFIPDAISRTTDGYRMVQNDPILWAMLNAIRELEEENNALRHHSADREELEELRTENEALRERLESLEARIERMETQ